MRFLVTGANGFIGSHLCKAILKLGDSVIGISRIGKRSDNNNNDINDKGLADDSYKTLSKSSNFVMLECDLISKEDTQGILESIGQKVDCIIHLAGLTFSRKDPVPGPNDYFANNFITTLNLLECCRLFNIKNFIFSSSIAVYGLSAGQYSPAYLPVDEKHSAKPYEFYDLSKLHAEQLCSYYHDRYDISCAVLRYSRVYGPGQERGIVYQAITKSLEDKPIDVKGDMSTDFVYVDDVVQAILLSIKWLQSMPKKSSNMLDNNKPKDCGGDIVFNIGGGREVTLFELCSSIVKLTGSSSNIRYYDNPKGKFWLDISKAMQVLQYRPISLEEGLIKSIHYIRSSLR